MKILFAEDDAVSRATLSAVLRAAGHEMTVAENGQDALDAWLLTEHRVVISDWMMPGLDGLELCRRIRARRGDRYTYFIMLTGKIGKENYLTAMQAGTDDFLTKPVDPDELNARLQVAERILGLHEEVHALEGLLPICSYCKRIRNERDEWSALEGYIEKRSHAEFTHGICPDCYARHVEPQLRG